METKSESGIEPVVRARGVEDSSGTGPRSDLLKEQKRLRVWSGLFGPGTRSLFLSEKNCSVPKSKIRSDSSRVENQS